MMNGTIILLKICIIKHKRKTNLIKKDKKGNKRPKFERLKEDIRKKKVNLMLAIKQDRISRSVYNWEEIISFIEENEADLEFVYDDINTLHFFLDDEIKVQVGITAVTDLPDLVEPKYT